ncbi:MAG TPA: hypothetical protein VH701_19070 [Vicinamibacterales bacterium]|jgi:hypothetical protein
MSRHWLAGASICVLVVGVGIQVAAQSRGPARGPQPGEVESVPIKCWWKTDKTTVQVGERFDLTLTCGVVETSRIKVVPKLEELEPGTVQLTPFEVMGGVHHDDIVASPWRYFQYQYTMRLLGDEFFGQDVNIPPLKVTYNIQSVQGGGTEGRDQIHLLPPMPIRVLSLVPRGASDIRDVSLETFGDIEARRFRASEELIAAGIFFGLAAVFLGVAVVKGIGRYRVRVPVSRTLPTRAVLSGGLREIGRLKSDVAREGWTSELAGRALSIFRIAGAVALDQPVAQSVVDPQVPGREGQLVLRKGLLKRRRALVSASTTADAITRELINGNGAGPSPSKKATLEEIRDSLLVFNAVRYGRNGHFETAELDRALDNGASALRRLRLAKLWPARSTPGSSKPTGLGGGEWSR